MALQTKRKATRIRLSDHAKKTLQTFSGVNPEVSPSGVKLFSEGVSGFREEAASFCYLIREDELSEE